MIFEPPTILYRSTYQVSKKKNKGVYIDMNIFYLFAGQKIKLEVKVRLTNMDVPLTRNAREIDRKSSVLRYKQ